LKKQTDGTRRRTLRADPDVESGFKELIMLRDYTILLRTHLGTVIREFTRKATASAQDFRLFFEA
jgi:hypothetical protein